MSFWGSEMVFGTSITMQKKAFLIEIAFCSVKGLSACQKIYYLHHAGFHLPPFGYILIYTNNIPH